MSKKSQERLFQTIHSNFLVSVVRALDYVWDAQTARVQASAAHFCFFFKISEITTTVFYLKQRRKINESVIVNIIYYFQ